MANFASSLSRTQSATQTAAPTIASNNAAAYGLNIQGGKGGRIVGLPGSVALGSLAGNASLEITTTDFGVLTRAVESQANVALANANLVGNSVEKLAQLAETKVTDGANLNQKTTQLGLVAFAVAAVAIGAFAFLFKR